MNGQITYSFKLDKDHVQALKVRAKENDRSLSGEIKHALKLHVAKSKTAEKR